MNVHRWMQADCARVVVRTFLDGERDRQAKPVASSCVELRCDAVVEVQPIRFRPFRISVSHKLDHASVFTRPLIEPDLRI
jgi:hypothetical protein